MEIISASNDDVMELCDGDLLYGFLPLSTYQHPVDDVISGVNRLIVVSIENRSFRDIVVSMGGIDTAPIWIYQRDSEHRYMTSGRYHLDQVRAWLFSITSSS